MPALLSGRLRRFRPSLPKPIACHRGLRLQHHGYPLHATSATQAKGHRVVLFSQFARRAPHGQSAVPGGAELAEPASSHGSVWPPPALHSLEEPRSHSACPERPKGRRQAVPTSGSFRCLWPSGWSTSSTTTNLLTY